VGITRLIPAPKTTAISELSTRAPAEPRNTESRELQSAEKQNVASCVLSPSSAKKIKPKVVNSILKSIKFLTFIYDSCFQVSVFWPLASRFWLLADPETMRHEPATNHDSQRPVASS
jgi:hypothetical protein